MIANTFLWSTTFWPRTKCINDGGKAAAAMGPAPPYPQRDAGGDALGMLDTITKYGGAEQRQVGLFHKEGIGKVVINLARGFKDVTNVYTQHEPPLRNILEKVIKADLRESQFPYVPEFAPVGSTKSWKPKEIIVFIVGGAGRGPGHLCGLSHSTAEQLSEKFSTPSHVGCHVPEKLSPGLVRADLDGCPVTPSLRGMRLAVTCCCWVL